MSKQWQCWTMDAPTNYHFGSKMGFSRASTCAQGYLALFLHSIKSQCRSCWGQFASATFLPTAAYDVPWMPGRTNTAWGLNGTRMRDSLAGINRFHSQRSGLGMNHIVVRATHHPGGGGGLNFGVGEGMCRQKCAPADLFGGLRGVVTCIAFLQWPFN